MKPHSLDTTGEMQLKHYEMMRALPAWKRLLLAFELTQATRKLILATWSTAFRKPTREKFAGASLLVCCRGRT